MPIYEYRCNECGHQFEVSQRMSDESLTECEVCGGVVTKMLFAPAIHFKGTGFHNTDYGSKRRGTGDEGGGGSDSGGSAGSNGSSNGASDGKSDGASTEKKAATTGSDSSSGGGKTMGLDKV